MGEPRLGRKVEVISGFIVSLAGSLWLLSFTFVYGKPPGILPRLGLMCALLCALGCLMLCWAASFAYLIRKRNWTPRACTLSGFFFMVPGLALFFEDTRYWSVGSLLTVLSPVAIAYCRKFAFPGITAEQAAAPPPPLSLTSK
jgi:hypothetical protein